jgi:dipeptidyl aminopeptidase/acylaminoacyl peptidase
MLRAILAASLALAAVREPVLKQIQLPHSYYWREMYIPQLTSGPSSAAWSPDGTTVIYSMKGSLWRQVLGTDEAVELTHGPGYDYQPDWSMDGRTVVFVRHDKDSMHLVRLDLATGREQTLTSGEGVDLEPRFSPDGKRIAFVSSRATGHFDLYVAGIRDIDDGDAGLAGVRPLVAGRVTTLDRYYYSQPDHAINPSWSPDGKRIYYVGNPEVAWGTGDIWSVAVDNPADRTRVLVEETTWSARPEMAHDGKRLLYASYQGRQWHQLWLTTPEGRSPLPLTFGDFDRKNARWSPDDTRLLYISNEGGNTSLWQQTVVGGAKAEVRAKTLRWKYFMAPLTLELRDEKGAPLPGRVNVLASDGRYYAPDDAWVHADDNFDRSRQSQETRYFHCAARCTLTVPLGSVTVTALHGFAHSPATRTITADAAGAQLALTLPANGLPARFGPHLSADLHVHMNYGGQYRQRLDGLAAQAAAEDLDVVYNLIVNKEQRFPDLANIAELGAGPRTIGTATIFQGQELHTSYWGHLGLLHLKDHFLTPGFASYRHTAMASPAPTNGVMADLAHQQGALVGYVHPFDWPIVPDKETSLSHALPVDVALGKTDYMEIVSFADHVATAGVWYRLLSLGYHLAAGAGTDAMTNYASLRGPVGLNRVYLRTESRDAEALKAAIKGGHGFATNGPLLGLLAGGKAPGETLELPAAGGMVTVDAVLRSIVPVTDWEIVFNGEVLQRLTPQKDGMTGEAKLTLPVRTSGWLLVRAVNPEPNPLVQDLYPYATTNPVWIEVKGKKPPSSPQDAAYFVRWIDRVIESAAARDDYNTAAEKGAVLDELKRARAIYEAKVVTGGARQATRDRLALSVSRGPSPSRKRDR